MSKFNSSYLLFIALVSAMGGLLFGYDWVVIGGAKPFYEVFFNITNSPSMQGWVMGSAILGCLLGVMISGSLSDKYGRKPLMIVASIFFTLAAVGTGLVDTIEWFIVWRVVGGVGIGIASNLSPMYIAEIAIAENRFAEAVQLLKETEFYPHNLGEGKLKNAEENEVFYYKGLAYKGLGDVENATANFIQATLGSPEPVQAFFYNDQQPDKIFYQGLAWRELGHEDKARSRFNKLLAHGEKYLFEKSRIDYFAVSLPDLAIWDDDLNVRNQVHCYYVMALGHSGLGKEPESETYYQKVKQLDSNKQTFRK